MAKESCATAANFNSLPQFTDALVRTKAKTEGGPEKKK
jgi:hypothetical protein